MKPQNYNNNYPQRRLNAVELFFLYCSGADLRVLLKPNDNIWAEHPKYVSIGAIILFTAVFAFISMSYAIYSVFNNTFVAILMGVLWGSFIFALDRLLVSSIRKTKYNKKGNEFLNEIIRSGIDLLKSTPRLVLAVFIGVVIAIPLELKLFEKEIWSQMQKEHKENALKEMDAYQNLQVSFATLKDSIRMNILKEQDKIIKQIDGLQKANEDFNGRFVKITNAESEESKQIKLTKNKNIQLRIDANNKIIDMLNSDLKKLIADSSVLVRGNNTLTYYENNILKAPKIELRDGLLARLQALQNLVNDPQKKAARNMYWGVILLIIAIEIMPVLVKILAGRGIYDDKVEVFYSQQALENRRNEVTEAFILKVYDEFDRGMNLLISNLQQISRANPAQRTFIENFIAAIKITIDTIKNNIDKLLK
ncbi:MAG TPA: DUF4407 domain-containing protein [Chitinophagales bacterium]|nr:DUF4407 domain-containing protein [Chitinophagales bacterium]